MNTSELKNPKEKLLVWIESLTDESILYFLQTLRLSSGPEAKDWWTILTERSKNNIRDGIVDYQQGVLMKSKIFWTAFNLG